MLKEKIRESESELSQRQCKWRNLYFSKSGKTSLGEKLHDTQEQAKVAVERSIANAKAASAKSPSGDCWFGQYDDKFLFSQYSWSMQIPVLD